MIDLANYITTEPEELIMQCIAVTRAALDTEDVCYRELLLYVLVDKQIELAQTLGTLNREDLTRQ